MQSRAVRIPEADSPVSLPASLIFSASVVVVAVLAQPNTEAVADQVVAVLRVNLAGLARQGKGIMAEAVSGLRPVVAVAVVLAR